MHKETAKSPGMRHNLMGKLMRMLIRQESCKSESLGA